jgi:phosphoglycolate phosphatase-like HAD superfamily hydrolase
MVGDSIIDMEFAKNAGMNGLFIGKSNNYKCIESLNDLRLKIKR